MSIHRVRSQATLLLAFSVVLMLLAEGQTIQAQSASRGVPTRTHFQPTLQGSSTKVMSGSSTKVATQRVGLHGYCPVCVVKMKKWVKGQAAYQSTYDNVTYWFPGAEQKAMFDKSPAQFVPALGGDCTVCYAMMGQKRVAGSVRHAALRGGRLFLFPGEEQKEKFRQTPRRFANVDLALGGDCVVCLVHMNKRVAGKPEFAEVYRGIRYLFPSTEQQQAFRKSPAQYAEAAKAATPPKVGKVSRQTIYVSGRSGCAGCDHGIAPLGAPDELGLAINASDGTIYVVEDAHSLYPNIYEKRFDGLSLKLAGNVIKRQDKFAWVKPTELAVANETALSLR